MFAFLVSLPAIAEPPARGPWTTPDRNAAIEVATETAATSSSLLLDLADVLERAGDVARAREAASRASLLLPTVDGKTDPFTRRRVATKLAELGDIASAEALAGPDASPAVKATLFGYIGAARAKVGDLVGARAQGAAVAALLSSATSSDIELRKAGAGALRDIGLALVAAGMPEEALLLADSLPDGLPKVWILGRSAQFLCRGPTRAATLERGRAIADRTVASMKAAVSPSRYGPEDFGLATISAEAVAVCDGPDEATTLVRELFAPPQDTVALARVAQQFKDDGDMRLATAVAPPPPPPPDPTRPTSKTCLRLQSAWPSRATRKRPVPRRCRHHGSLSA